MTGVDAGDHAGFGFVHQFVGQALQAVGQRRGLGELQVPSFAGLSVSDQADRAGDDLDEFLVIGAHPRHHFDLVLGQELEPVEVVAELFELTQRRVEPAVVRLEQRGRNAVELADGVVVELPIGADLAL